MKEFIQELSTKKTKRYKDDYSEMLGDYNRELETIKGYNGRQLLELLQNSDDEGATQVAIKLDTASKTISINNNGDTSFSKKGYRSLFIANLSSKTSKRKYIGNKGLGFRSIINWSNAIEIQSNDLSLQYSETNTKARYESLFTTEQRATIAKEENLSSTVIPMPFLCLPVIKEITQENFKTSIVISYKEKAFKDIYKQVKSITPETLLFLNHIKQIDFIGFEDKPQIKCNRSAHIKSSTTFSPQEAIQFPNNSWSIFEEEDELPLEFQDVNKTEKEFYQIKIAVEDNFEKTSPYLYSFFPTNIKLNQPYVLHATFDLDATRNQLNDSEKNRFILEKVVAFTTKVARYFTDKKVSYQPLSILHHKHKADTLQNLGYYDIIEEAINTEAVFPCIDNTYKKIAEILYVNDEFAQLLIESSATDTINCHLIPLKGKTLTQFDLDEKVDRQVDVLENYIDVLNSIGSQPLSIGQRAKWIRLLTQKAAFIKKAKPNQLDFLVNNNNTIIKGKEYIYTPVTKNNPLKTPNFTDIQFVGDKFFEALLREFKFYDSDNPNKGRFIYDELKGYFNIHSYEPATLSQKIIRETKNQIERHNAQSIAIIKEMNSCLYHNFKLMKEDTKIPDDVITIPSISKASTIVDTENLVLSSDYPTGIKTTLIFEEVYDNSDFVANPSILGLPNAEDKYQLEKFLKWIKVNSYARYKRRTNITSNLVDYVNYVQSYDGYTNRSSYKLEFLYITDFEEILNRLSIEKLILWVYYDDRLKRQLYDSANEDKYEYYYFNYKTVYTKPSYIKYYLTKNYKFKFSDLLIDEKYSWVNDFRINYNQLINLEQNLNKTKINEILVSLGATDDFNDLSIKRVAEIINKLPNIYPSGAKSQTFYKRALSHYNKNNVEIEQPLSLFASNGNELRLYPQEQIYFSDKIKLPNKLREAYPIFNYPARAGGADAIKFFGINDLKTININITYKNEIDGLTADFGNLLDELKPLLLSYRLNVIEDIEPRKTQASICKKIEIILCSEIKYEVYDKSFVVSDYEFLHRSEQTYYIKISEHDTIDSLKRNVEFTNSFANCISLAFDVNNDKNEYKYILRSDIDDVQNSIKNDLGIDTFNDARELLGLADYKQAFWQAVFLSKDKVYDDFLDDLSLEKRIAEIFGLEYDSSSIDYEQINTESELVKIEGLFNKLDIELSVFASHYSYKISLAQWHLSTIKDAILSKNQLVKASIRENLRNSDLEKKAQFLDICNRFNNYLQFAQQKAHELRHNFKVDKTAVYREYIALIYPTIKIESKENIALIRSKNEEKFTTTELYEISLNPRLKSLLYFEDKIDEIKKELIAEKANTKEETISNETSGPSTRPNTTRVLSSKLLKPKKAGIFKGSNNVFTPGEKDQRKLKIIGNTSEQIVYDELVKMRFTNVDHISKDNEGLHYDIRYTNAEGVVKYVEVKTFDTGSFFLSKSEYDFGKQNLKDYEIWLVKNKQDIIPIYDFFTNKKYQVITNEYIVHMKLDKD
ncbi:hypothetical protein MED134_06889 [Dokdonia sp. MED134]|uniref:DUF3883 domain-containing protein n=1 Tax=Dokdonia sp. MED134 TaxID=313590 RepID=UPI000068ABFF|nr:DUF3883 domain-containing protein [Dokdonia sp. MED134]EAQ40461.1 hypothetical protein MED134_06889 [Dokdonia sp. MED134]